MEFKPYCMATSIGSMPHTDPNRACQILLDSMPEAPFMPALVKTSFLESAGAYRVSQGMPCLVVDREARRIYFDTSRNVEEELTRLYDRYLSQDLDYFAIGPEHNLGFFAMLEMLREKRPKNLKLVQYSTTGPFSFGMRMTDENRRPIFYNKTIRDAIVKTLVMKARWQRNKIRQAIPGVSTMHRINEPLMQLYSSAYVGLTGEEVVESINELAGATSDLTFLHCCANPDWSILMESSVDILNFDAYQYALNISLYPRELRAFLNRGGMLAWGIVPTHSDAAVSSECVESLVPRLEQAMQLLVDEGFDKDMLLEGAFVTASCGTGNLSVESAERVLRLTGEVSEAMRNKYFRS